MISTPLRHELVARLRAGATNLRERLQGQLANLQLPDRVDPLDWIEDNVPIPSTVSTETGTIELFGYQRALLRLFFAPTTRKMAVPKAVRTGITQLFTAAAAKFVAHDRRPVGFWQPTEDDAKSYYSDYWSPTIKESPTLSKLQRRPGKGETADRWNWQQLTNGGKMQLKFATKPDQFRRVWR